MGSLTDYFAENAHKPKWKGSERVFGQVDGIPFIGTVYHENLVNTEFGPQVIIQLDLPIVDVENGVYHRLVIVKPNDIKLLKNFENL